LLLKRFIGIAGHCLLRKRSLKSKFSYALQNWAIVQEESGQNIGDKIEEFADVRIKYRNALF
jgi:hypothetical protein